LQFTHLLIIIRLFFISLIPLILKQFLIILLSFQHKRPLQLQQLWLRLRQPSSPQRSWLFSPQLQFSPALRRQLSQLLISLVILTLFWPPQQRWLAIPLLARVSISPSPTQDKACFLPPSTPPLAPLFLI